MFLKQLFGPTRLILNQCQQTRTVSILTALDSSPILVSSNRDIYTNLALEHWLYTNLRFDQNEGVQDGAKINRVANYKHPIVLIWTDEPCVVIGRHQNPWVETTQGLVNKLGIKLARRHSGGGCVYHDENNINISIIGDRKIFDNRQGNLKFLADVLSEKYGIACEPNKRHDLISSTTGRKLSGSAAKLGRFNSYHHFTLLVDTDTEIMQAVIRQKQQDFISTNSSTSTRSNVVNLCELKSGLTVQQVISDLVQAYAKYYKSLGTPTGSKKETKVEGDQNELESLNKFKEDLLDWKWIYGMTPNFKLERSVSLMDKGEQKVVHFRVAINRGLFESFEIDCDSEQIRNLVQKFNHLIGTSFAYKDAMLNVVKMLQIDENSTESSVVMSGGEQIFATYLLQMIHETNF